MSGDDVVGVAPVLPSEGVRREHAPGVLRLRLVLAVFWSSVALLMLLAQVLGGPGGLTGPQERTLDDLYAAADLGRTGSVMLTPGLGPDVFGEVTQRAWWDEDGRSVTATWVAVSGDPSQGDVSSGDVWSADGTAGQVTTDDVAQQLRRLQPDLVVETTLGEPGSGVTLSGVHLPEVATPLAALFLVAWFATLVLLVNGPQPWRATRWAWFWLAAPPLGLLAFVVLSGPAPGLGTTRPVGRRLTGGWAFLVALLLGAVLGQGWWW